MKRREFLTMLSAGAAWPRLARAEEGRKVARIGYLSPTVESRSWGTRTILDRMRELGWEEGRNLEIDERMYGSDFQLVTTAAADFLRNKVDVIVVGSTNVARVVQSLTRTIPIVVVTGSDPIGAGVAASLARPGGMVT